MELLYEDIAFKIRGAALAVYNELGGAFRESVVDKALTIELIEKGLKIENQKRIDIFYKGKKVETCIPDKIIEEKVLVEVKCKSEITGSDEEQFWKYLRGSKYRLGILINFGPKRLDFKRIIFDKIKNPRLSAAMKGGENNEKTEEILLSKGFYPVRVFKKLYWGKKE